MLKYEVLYDEYKEEKLARIRLTDDKWNGIIYHYDTVKILQDDDGTGNAILQFEYDVVEAPYDFNEEKIEPRDKEEFENLLGDILVEIITEASYENRADDTDESDLQRGLHKESSAVS